jgi:hypothetical protein
MHVAPVQVQVRPLGPVGRAVSLPFDTRSIGIVPYRPANAGIHDATAEAAWEAVCEELPLFNAQGACNFVAKLPERMQALCDPKSDKVLEIAKLSSSALGLVPQLPPGVEALSIVFGSVEVFKGWRSNALSPLEVGFKSGNLVFETLSIVADHFGYPVAANAGRVVAFLLRRIDSSTQLVFAHEGA